jgi:CDP-glucose 4,6-dehydratase
MNSSSPAISETPLEATFRGKVVWLSGHTGFKGSWLAHWLLDLGAEVHGFSLPPPTTPALFDQLGLAQRLHHQLADLRDAAAVRESIKRVRPDFVFHLAAQAIVRASFEQPVETYSTNLLGTIHVLEALRTLERPCAAILITSDKCYENQEWVYGYREEDPLGGYDPYSSSKASAEIAIASWRRSFFADHPVRIASARAGNVIGGGDWAKDRIVPDCIRALQLGQPIGVRNKMATRPWQHVLEPLSGYLWLAAVLMQPSLRPYDGRLFTSAFNFGPSPEANRTVAELVTEVLKRWPGRWEDRGDPKTVHEAKLLSLAPDKAFHLLGWKAVWSFEKAIDTTVAWYRKAYDLAGKTPWEGTDLLEFTSRQIAEYEDDAARAALPWAVRRARM